MVTHTFVNGTVAEADEVNRNFSDVETIWYADNTGGSVSNTTTETDLATFTIAQNDMSADFDVMITSPYKELQGASIGATSFRLYVNGSIVKTQTADPNPDAGTDESGSSFSILAQNLDSTAGNIIIKVTAQAGTASASQTSTVHSLTATAKNN